jgi:hypothetical protein
MPTDALLAKPVNLSLKAGLNVAAEALNTKMPVSKTVKNSIESLLFFIINAPFQNFVTATVPRLIKGL